MLHFTQHSVWQLGPENGVHATDHSAQLTCLFYGPGLTACRLNAARNTQVVQGEEVIVLFSFRSMGDKCWGLPVGTDQIAKREAKRECTFYILYPQHVI